MNLRKLALLLNSDVSEVVEGIPPLTLNRVKSLRELTAFGKTEVHKKEVLFGRYVPVLPDDIVTYPMVDTNGNKAVQDIGKDGTQTGVYGYYDEDTNTFTQEQGMTGSVIQPVDSITGFTPSANEITVRINTDGYLLNTNTWSLSNVGGTLGSDIKLIADDIVCNNGVLTLQDNELQVIGTQEKIQIDGANIFNKNNLLDGFLPASGNYPTTNPSYPNSKYTLIPLKTGQSISMKQFNFNNTGRLRCIYDNQVIGNILAIPNDYYTATASGSAGFVDNTITAKKDIIIGVLNYTNNTGINDSLMIVYGSTIPTTYEPYITPQYNLATNLNGIDDYLDEHDTITGNVIRKVSVKVLKGTESWGYATGGKFFYMALTDGLLPTRQPWYCMCSHFPLEKYADVASASGPNHTFAIGYTTTRLIFKMLEYTTADELKAYLAAQYAQGTPVIIVYPLETTTTETTTPQSMTLTAGNYTATIPEASLDDLKLRIKYKKG